MIDIKGCLIKPDDIVLHSNDEYQHIVRGRLNLLVHTESNIEAEKLLPSSYQLDLAS
jgi:hypothetical protein